MCLYKGRMTSRRQSDQDKGPNSYVRGDDTLMQTPSDSEGEQKAQVLHARQRTGCELLLGNGDVVKGVASPQLRPIDGSGFDEEPPASRSRKRLNKKRADSDSDDDNSDDGRSIATTPAKKPRPEVLASNQDTDMPCGPCLCRGCMASWLYLNISNRDTAMPVPWLHGSWPNLGTSDRDTAMPVPWLHGA